MDNNNQYSKRIVAFIDILGFSDYIAKSDNDNEKYLKVQKLITDVNSKIETDFYDDFRDECRTENEILSISDSIVISHPFYEKSEFSDGSFLNIIQDVLEYQLFLLENGWLCRGAICFGNLYHRKNAIFGKFYIDAYELESKKAQYPRIIISKDLQKYFGDSRK